MGEYFAGGQKRRARLWAVAAGLWLLAAVGAAGAKAQKPSPVVSAETFLATTAAHAGASIQAAVVAQVVSGYHINEHHPTLDYLIPTELKLQPAPRLSVVKTLYPKGELVSFAFSDTRLSVYEGRVPIGALLKVASGTPPGEYTLKGKLEYQACNDHACLPPASVPVAFTVRVVPRRVAVKPANREVFRQIHFE